jgi:hypothetical protein
VRYRAPQKKSGAEGIRKTEDLELIVQADKVNE